MGISSLDAELGGGDDDTPEMQQARIAGERVAAYFDQKVNPLLERSVDALGASGAAADAGQEMVDFVQALRGLQVNYATGQAFGSDTKTASMDFQRKTAKVKNSLREALPKASPQDAQVIRAGYQAILDLTNVLEPKELDRRLRS